MDLLIKKVFVDYFNELSSAVSKERMNKKKESEGVFYSYASQVKPFRELGNYFIEIYLYSKVMQIPTNASLFIVSMKNMICDEELCIVQSSGISIIFYRKNKSCIWGSLVTFAIKMNFID